MSVYSYSPDNAASTPPSGDLQIWIDRRKAARAERQRYERTWRLCSHFISNKQWMGWNRKTREIVDTRQTLRERNREHYTANVITQYLWTIIGKLLSDDFRPDLTFRRDDEQARSYAAQAQRATEFAWDEEIGADEVLFEVIYGGCSYGTSGWRCRYDLSQGKLIGDMPVQNGDVITDPAKARAYMADRHAQGMFTEQRSVREGKLCWEPLLPDNILPPPGVRREDQFPWLILERPVPLASLRLTYPAAKEITAETLSSLDTVGMSEDAAKLKGHVLLATGYERPSPDFPQGRTVVWAGDTQLEARPSLPYTVQGEPKMGVFFFHYHRLADRFWSQGAVEPLIGPQVQRNRARSQLIEMKDRMGLGRVYAEEGTLTVKNMPQGKIGELVEVKPGRNFPQETPGTGPGPWLEAEVAMNDADMDRIAGVREVSMGSAPQGVSAYSAMALLKEEDDRRVGPILQMMRTQVKEAVEVTLEAMRRYWPSNKEILIAGDDGIMDAFTFNASGLSAGYFVRVGTGSPAPRSSAAMVQMCFDLYDRSISGGQPLPLSWLKDSLMAERPQPLPKAELDVQRGKAELENMLLARGQQVMPADYDDDQLHIQVHRAGLAPFDLIASTQGAEAEQAKPITTALKAHIQAHLAQVQIKQGQQGAAGVPGMQGPQGILSQAPPGPGPAGVGGDQSGGGGMAPGSWQGTPYRFSMAN